MPKIKAVHEIIEELTGQESQIEHKLVYDSPTETLEPIYFFILDLMNDFGLEVEKLTDNFVSSPGSQHFGEMGQRASIMQQQGAKLMGDINTVLRSILNLIYDLREFKIRLQSYKDLKDSSKKQSALLSLKQIWMDKVDVQKGNSSIKAMALGQAGFNTLIDAFLVVNSDEEIDKLDLNQIVKRILKPRLHEFQNWVKNSEQELQKRFEIEKTYLKSQVNSLKIYSRWAKPYMKAAQELEMGDSGRNPALVKMFNSLILELTLLGKKENKGTFPHMKKYNPRRKYYDCVLVDFLFRGIPSKTQQGFVVGGRAEITFRAYSLNSEELEAINKEIEKSDLNNALSLIEGTTTESLESLKEDIDEYLEDSQEEEEKPRKKKGTNPFLALFGAYNEKSEKPKKKAKKRDDGKIAGDNWIEESYFREPSQESAKDTAFQLFEIYKKAHGMASFPT